MRHPKNRIDAAKIRKNIESKSGLSQWRTSMTTWHARADDVMSELYSWGRLLRGHHRMNGMTQEKLKSGCSWQEKSKASHRRRAGRSRQTDDWCAWLAGSP
jgi:hypothetical protein